MAIEAGLASGEGRLEAQVIEIKFGKDKDRVWSQPWRQPCAASVVATLLSVESVVATRKQKQAPGEGRLEAQHAQADRSGGDQAAPLGFR